MKTLKLISPTEYPIITQGFGENKLPLYKKLGMLGHNGLDLVCGHGSPIYACHDGIVTFVGDAGDAGNRIDITTETGDYSYKDKHVYFTTVYMHNDSFVVHAGDRVEAGDLIAYGDSTGASTGDHCHLSLLPKIKDGNLLTKLEPDNGYSGCIDPSPYFDKKPNGEIYRPSDVRTLKQTINDLRVKIALLVKGRKK